MGGVLSVLAPVLTVAVALLTKNVIIALFIGIFYSSILINGVNFLVPMADYILQGIQGNGFILVLFNPSGRYAAVHASRRRLQSVRRMGAP